MPPPMALPLPTSASASSTLPTLPPFRPCPPAALRLPSVRARARAVSAGYAASFYGGSAAATGGADDEEVGDEEGSASGFGSGLGLGGGGLGMSAADAALALEEREMPPCPPGLRQYETMVVLRPDMSEEERLALIQRYEESCLPCCFPACGAAASRRRRRHVRGGVQPWRHPTGIQHQEEEQQDRAAVHLLRRHIPPRHLLHQARVPVHLARKAQRRR
ncbi:unnamed protein product [Urochloa decumbens]|uniref:Uncharacterized protein n=1 Tax=Urochloa decumbens TaxID=240449 RepID=A0ABC8X3S7_9POAL